MSHADSPELEVEVSKIISANRASVLKMLSQVQDFPKYMPNVRSCQVLETSKHSAVTRWNVEFNKIPITWVEKETFDLTDYTVRFQAIEGDLEHFEGKWTLKEHPSGTDVHVWLKLKIGIPHLEQLISSVVRQIIAENFKLMLDAIEDRLIKERYQRFKRGEQKEIQGFAILGHPYNFNHLVDSLRILGSDLKPPSRKFLNKLFEITPSYKIFDIPSFTSPSGKTTHGSVIICTIVPDMLEMSLDLVFAKVVEACRVAQRHNLGIVCLGGFTSIAGERFGKEISDGIDIAVTTGNTFTAGLALEGVYQACQFMEINLSRAKATVIGGAGDIGSACARVLSHQVESLTITGRSLERLHAIKKQLSEEGSSAIQISTQNNEAVSNADIVICAAATSQSIVDINQFKSGAVVCDVGYPKNISYKDTSRGDILVFSGGLAEAPQEVDLGFNLHLPGKKLVYGCSAEAVLLALEGRYENFSSGRGKITKEKIDGIMQIGKKHGFRLAPFFWGSRMLGEKDIEQVRKKRVTV